MTGGRAGSETDHRHDRRLGKLFIDTGRAGDEDAASAILRELRLQLILGAGVARSETLQAAAATIVAAGVRAFPAGINLVLAEDGPVRINQGGDSLATLLADLGAEVGELEPNLPSAVIGAEEDSLQVPIEVAVRAVPRGWAGGVVPAADQPPPIGSGALGATVAASLAVSELFHAVHGLQPLAAHRPTGLSLWRPDLDWIDPGAEGPDLEDLPRRLWLLGLGHLGQATAWLLGLLPWAVPEQLVVFLQDYDTISAENFVTSLYASPSDEGEMKTRRVAAALETLGHRTRLIERRFDGVQQRQPRDHDEPDCAISGFDTAAARRPLDQAGFPHLVDAGIGAGAGNFTQFNIHRLGGTRHSREIFDVPVRDRTARLIDDVEFYRRRAQADGHTCGAMQMAGQAVGTSFVGVMAAAVSLSELLRPLHGGPEFDVLAGDLRDPGALQVALRNAHPVRVPDSTPGRRPADS